MYQFYFFFNTKCDINVERIIIHFAPIQLFNLKLVGN